jgi:hypothetical protein
MPDVWTWFQGYRASLYHSGTPAHHEMLQVYDRANFLGGASSHLGLPLLHETRRRADDLGETCFSLFLAHWITENLLWQSRDYAAALENALGAVLTMRKVKDRACPLEDRLHINLIEVYTEVDPGGYRREIEDNLDYVTKNVELDYESHCMMAFRHGLMHARLGEDEAARSEANRCLATVEEARGADYYRAVAHFVLSVVAFKSGDMPALRTTAAIGARMTRSGVPPIYEAEFALWEALAVRRLGENGADAKLREAVILGQRDPGALSFAYFDALVAWQVDQEKFADAIAAREAQSKVIDGHGRALDTVELWLDGVKLRQKAGLPTDEAAQAVRDAAAKLRQPQPYLDQLAALL